MSSGWRWVIWGVAVGLLVVGLLLFARGRPHHHGRTVGERASAPEAAVMTLTAT